MARNTFKNFSAAVRKPFSKRFGFAGEWSTVDADRDNDSSLNWSDAADVTSLPAIRVDADNRFRRDDAVAMGERIPLTFNIATGATLATQAFYIADRAMVITGIEYTHSTPGSDAGTVSAQITHETGVQTLGTGVATLQTAFNCKGTANTVQFGTLIAPTGIGDPATAIVLAAGDRLSIVFTGTLTALAGVLVTVYVRPGFKIAPAIYNMHANASLATQGFFQANKDMQIVGANIFYGTAGTDAGTVTIDITHDTSTNAPGAGSSILSAAQSAKSTASTVYSQALTATASRLTLNAGDRLSVKFTGTLTALADVVVVVYMQSVGAAGYYGQVEANYNCQANGSIATQEFFIADRDYELVDASLIWSTAGSDGGTVTADVQIDKGTTAPGSGASALNAAVSVKTTANTTAVAVLAASRRLKLLSMGDRLCMKTSGTLTALAGLDVTVTLLPR